LLLAAYICILRSILQLLHYSIYLLTSLPIHSYLLKISLFIPSKQIIMQLTSLTQLLAVALMATVPFARAAPVRSIQNIVWFRN